MVAKKQTVSVSKSIINAIVSSGENGISVQELMDQYKCTKTTIYAAINFSRKMKKEHKQVGYPGSIVSIDGRYYHKMEIDQPDKAHMIKPPTPLIFMIS